MHPLSRIPGYATEWQSARTAKNDSLWVCHMRCGRYVVCHMISGESGSVLQRGSRRGARDAVGVDRGGERELLSSSPSHPGVWGSVVSSPAKLNLVHFICYRTLLVEEKSNRFVDNYSGRNKPTIPKNQLFEIHKSSVIIWSFNTCMTVINWQIGENANNVIFDGTEQH